MAVTVKKDKRSSRDVGHGKLPTKRSINLASIGEKPINPLVAIPAILLIILAAVALSKFAVVDRLLAVNKAQAEAAAVKAQVDAGYARIGEFGELSDTYAHYTYSGMNEEELSRADRIAAIDVIDRIIVPEARVNDWAITGNQMVLTVVATDLQKVNQIVQRLEEEPNVDYCSVSTAATNESYYNGYKVIDETGSVTARITAYLVNALEVENG